MRQGIFDMLFIQGFRAAESTSPIEYKVSKLLVNDTRKINTKLLKIICQTNLNDIDLDTLSTMITKFFEVSEGEVETRIKTSAVTYDGHVGFVDVSGTIDLVSITADIELLYEDLLQAFYKARGGKFGLSKDFINFVVKDVRETSYSKFVVI